ncbi:hypothetical protein IFM89_020098 [Coptis chinensis]|uniref:Retrotransposon Copia-like N-terminal domain-containing protein n=1 Tax=Coptis chinensis TaxID=261450 RepID=A0A835HFT1_9MAGN|nr:hypothetical protein IFM89_020098 [Coptis chinensis]
MDDEVNPRPDSKPSLYYVNDDLGKSITNFRLNGNNYLSWSYVVEHFIRAKKTSKILTDDPPNSNDSTYEDWMGSNSMVLTWLWNNMEPKVLTNVQFSPTAKRVWSSLKMYSQENNISRIYDLFESLFKTKQGDQPIDEYYSTMKGLWEELLFYQPFTVNLEKQREQREQFQVALLLHGLNSEYSVYKDQILASETVLFATQAFSRLKRKCLEHGEFVPVAKESSALLSTLSNCGGRGGFGGGRGFNGRGTLGNSGFGRVNHGGFGGRRGRVVGIGMMGTDKRKCTHCGKDGHTEPFCWDKHGKPAYANNVYDQTFGSSTVAPSVASNPSIAEVLGQILNRLNFVPIPIVPFEEVPPSPVVPSEEVPPSPVMPCAEGPSRVPITTVRWSMPIYAQYHRIFPRKKVTNFESATVTTVEPALN